MLVIKIEDGSVNTRTVRGKNGDFQSSEQHGVVELPNGERRVVRIRVTRDQAAYPVGSYVIDDKSFGVDQWGSLAITGLRLSPLRAAASAPGASAVR